MAYVDEIPGEKYDVNILYNDIKLPNNKCQKDTKAFKQRFRNKKLSCHMAFFILHLLYVRKRGK